MRTYIAISVLLLSPTGAMSSEDGKFTIYGAGTESCGRWLADRHAGDWYLAGQWVLWWISAYGYYGSKDLRKTDSDAIAVWIDNYCAAHPLDELSLAAEHLVGALSSKS
jgi:hypothetical protein